MFFLYVLLHFELCLWVEEREGEWGGVGWSVGEVVIGGGEPEDRLTHFVFFLFFFFSFFGLRFSDFDFQKSEK
jgi:hypothetical protein